jgi:phage FluMu protein Com
MKCSICGGNKVYWADFNYPSSKCPDCGAINSVIPEEDEGEEVGE